MIRVNLARGKQNNMSKAQAEMIIAGKLGSLGYVDNPYEMDVGLSRCRWVRYRMEMLSPCFPIS